MGSRIFSFMNHKGGVGKTTSAAALGRLFALRGFRVLLVDLDSQANLTFTLCPEASGGRTVYNALLEGRGLPVVGVRENLFLSPSSFELAGVEFELEGHPKRERILSGLLSEVSSGFDIVILDTPPSVGLVALNAMAAAEEVIVPIVAEALPLQGLKSIEAFMAKMQPRFNPSLRLSGIILCKWEARKLNRMIEEAVRAKYGGTVFDTVIRSNIAIAEAPLSGGTITEYSARSRGAEDYALLAEEFLSRFPIGRRGDAENGNTVTR